MSLKGWLFGDFIEEISFKKNNTLIYRFPLEDKEISYNAKIEVSQDQIAVIKVGNVFDILNFGSHSLYSKSLKNIAKSLNWDSEYDEPFIADIFFISKDFFNYLWKTEEPILLRDRDDSVAKVDMSGSIKIHIKDISNFLRYIYSSNKAKIQNILLDNMIDALSKRASPIYRLAQDKNEFGIFLKSRVVDKFAKNGLILDELHIEYLDVEQILPSYHTENKSCNSNKYYIVKHSKPDGPYSKEDILKMIDNTELIPASYIWREGLEDWVKVKELFNIE